jgi:hypothetical protein
MDEQHAKQTICIAAVLYAQLVVLGIVAKPLISAGSEWRFSAPTLLAEL